MPTIIATQLTTITSVSLSFLGGVVATYWPYILGLIVLTGLAYRFRSTVGLVR